MRHSIVLAVLFAAAVVTCARRDPPEEAPRRLSKFDSRVHAIGSVRPEPVSGVYANNVTGDIVIGVDGTVETVTVTDGDPAQRQSAIAAMKQQRFEPVVIDGTRRRVITTWTVHVPDDLSIEQLTGDASPGLSATVESQRHVVLTADCSRAAAIEQSENAISVCREALDAVNHVSRETSFQERRSVHAFLGQAYVTAKRWREAVGEFEAAIKVENERDVNSYKTAELYGMIAAVHVLRGDLSTADRFATLAISAHESAAAAHPGEREQLASQLRTLLMIEGEIKRRRGDTAGAEARERTAESIPAR